MLKLPTVQRGDRVAVVSPSAGLPALFPEVFELGLTRLRERFGVEPVEYPTTRTLGACLQDRARDVTAAFADPDNKAVFTSIGGQDQIQLLKLLDPQVFIDNPKPFFGYSDNTHLHNFLWRLGIPSYYGCAVMTQLGMHGAMFEMTERSLDRALFERGEQELFASDVYNDEGIDWSDAAALTRSRKLEPNDGWFWDGTSGGEGRLWGGCVESLVVQLGSQRWLPSDEALKGCILYLETAEDIPEPWIVEYALIAMGERGWLSHFNGVVVGRPKAWEFDKPNGPEKKAAYRAEQRDAVLKTVRQYNSEIPVVQNLDFGHTDPQAIVPSGNTMGIDTTQKRIFVTY